MSQHDLLRKRYEQHKAKNDYSKIDDEQLYLANEEVLSILKETYTNHTFELKKSLTFKQIENYSKINFQIDFDYSKRKLLPDGGVIWMDNKYPILISESKRQGTNKERIKEGKKKQAVGNAVERLGKNLCGIEALYTNDDILPFVCFCHGCDFIEPTVLCKLYTMNMFQALNVIYTDISNFKRNKPFTIMAREQAYTLDELIYILLQVVEYSINYYEEKIKWDI